MTGRKVKLLARTAWLCLLAVPSAFAQDPSGAIEGAVTSEKSAWRVRPA